MWTVAFVGPVPVAQHLCGPGEGEASAARARVARDAPHGPKPPGPGERGQQHPVKRDRTGPTLDVAEDMGLHYVVGARGLARAGQVLDEQPATQWAPSKGFRRPGTSDARVCSASLQCEQWERPRTLVARRWGVDGDMFGHELAVLTNLTAEHPRMAALIAQRGLTFEEAVLWLHDTKGACETHFKSLLGDLGLHYPPSQRAACNRGFYAVGLLAGMLSAITAVLEKAALGGALPTVATLRRRFWALPGIVRRHGRTAVVTVQGLTREWHEAAGALWGRVCRC